MVTAVVSLVLIAVGVVLVGVLLTRPRFYSRMTPWSGDPWANWMRRHRLSVAEAGELEHGVARGREFFDPRLRAAAVDWAGLQLKAYEPGRGGRIAIGVYVILVVGVTCARVVAGDRVSWSGPVILVVFGVLAVRQRRQLRRAIEANR
ncbi:hypothetical protein [Blastococcus sp. TBT05-19]|uniref:hypothetical protein n=1 Tax=Blastococcus sp. TBT05-19 TaxID=2250581 RepID=UPI0011BD7183|nr:hypothetical protein [Blastococcus sp. TBT05-19]